MAGRKPEQGGGDWMTVQEAADALSVKPHAIRARLERGTLEGKRYERETAKGTYEARWQVSREAVGRELAQRSDVARREDVSVEVEGQSVEMRDLFDRVLEAATVNREIMEGVRRDVQSQREEVVAILERLAEQLELNNRLLDALNRRMEQDGERDSELAEKIGDYLNGETERREAKRSSWWRRLFS